MGQRIRNWRTEEQQAFPNQVPVDNSNYLNIINKMSEEQNARIAKSGDIMANQIMESGNTNKTIADMINSGVEGYYTGKEKSEESAARDAQRKLTEAQTGEIGTRAKMEEDRFGITKKEHDAMFGAGSGKLSNFEQNQIAARAESAKRGKMTDAEIGKMNTDALIAKNSAEIQTAANGFASVIASNANKSPEEQDAASLVYQKQLAAQGMSPDKINAAINKSREIIGTNLAVKQGIDRNDPAYQRAQKLASEAPLMKSHLDKITQGLNLYKNASVIGDGEHLQAAREMIAEGFKGVGLDSYAQEVMTRGAGIAHPFESNEKFFAKGMEEAIAKVRNDYIPQYQALPDKFKSNPDLQGAHNQLIQYIRGKDEGTPMIIPDLKEHDPLAAASQATMIPVSSTGAAGGPTKKISRYRQ